MRPLFVGGAARSGTTAFAEYLNRHEEILLCEERFKGIQDQVSWDLFSFERIMDFSRPKETEKPPLAQTREEFIERHSELLSVKEPSKLRWLGDKGPFYVRSMERLAADNPGARFIMLYRPIEEVAESWDSRAKDSADPWSAERGVERSVEVWNGAMRGMRRFAKSSPAPRLLIVAYHDFFYRTEVVVPQLSRFLGLSFDEATTGAWREESREFEGRRRRKGSLNDAQRSFVEQRADREAEAWVLDRIEKQWREPALYAEENDEAALASLDEIESRMWGFRLRATELKSELKRAQSSGGCADDPRPETEGHVRTPPENNRNLHIEIEQVRAENESLDRRNRNLRRQLESVHSSRAWRILLLAGRIKRRIFGRG